MKRREFMKAVPAMAGMARSARALQAGLTFYSPLAKEWFRGGKYFEWTSTTKTNDNRKVKVFWRTFGDRSRPALDGFDWSATNPRLR